MKTAPELGRRLEIQNLISTFETEMVDIESFVAAVRSKPILSPMLESINVDNIRLKYRSDNKMPRAECEELLLGAMNASGPPSAALVEPQSLDPEAVEDPSLLVVERQKMALNIEISQIMGSIHVSILETDDPRVTMAPENKLIVHSNSRVADLVSAYTNERNISEEAHIATLFDFTERVILKTCQRELRLLDEALEDCSKEVKTMASLVLASEENMMAAIKEKQKSNFVSNVMKGGGGRRGSVMRDIQSALAVTGGGDGSGGGGGKGTETPTAGRIFSFGSPQESDENAPSRLAAKLNSLQLRVVEAEKELKYYQELERKLDTNPNLEILPPPAESSSR